MKILSWKQISELLKNTDLLPSQAQGFLAYSQGKSVMPSIGHLHIPQYSGECHIKHGYLQDDSYFIIKIATSFFHNTQQGLANGNGMMILFDIRTGAPLLLLQDEGKLTDLRTAIAGEIVAQYFAPKRIHRIGIVGTGVQAQMQLLHLQRWTKCRDVLVWGRNTQSLANYHKALSSSAFQITTTHNIQDITSTCNFIVTATASTQPLIQAEELLPGTHITALGADGNGKQELDPALFQRADLCIVDSFSQCSQFGEASFALKQGFIQKQDLIELGQVIAQPQELTRKNDQQISIADLTGLAVQDLQMAKVVFNYLKI